MVKKSQTYARRSKNPQWIKQKKEASKRWYLKNREKLIEKQRQWDLANPEKVKRNHKKAMTKFVASGKMSAYMKLHYKKNKDKYRVRNLTLYHKKKLLSHLSDRCFLCGSKESLEFHHENYDVRRGHVYEDLKKITKRICRSCHRNYHKQRKILK